MAENYGFFNAQLVEGEPDRVYEASDFAGYYASLIGNGVFANPSTNLQVMPNISGLSIVIKPGKAFINGYWYNLTEEAQIALSTAPSSGIRYDAIILELSLNTRRIGYKYLEGISTGNPPQSSGFLTRNDNIYQVCLAYISVAAGATQINSRDITDTRPNNDYCGWVTGLVKQITTTDLFDQYNDAFNDWFESVKDLLDETDVYKIETQINSIIQLLGNGITTLKEINNGVGFRIWLGTTDEYHSLETSKQILENVLYIKTDDTSAEELRNFMSDSNWQTLTIESPVIGSERDAYWAPESGGKIPRYRKIGNHVYIQGFLMADMEILTRDWVGTGYPLVDATAAQLPSSYKPSQFFYKIVPVQGARYAAILVASNGHISVAYVKDSEGNNVTTGQYWIQLDCDFLVD